MKELNELLEELQKEVNLKENKISINNVTQISLIKNRKIEITNFESAIKNVSKDSTLKNEIIKNFRETAKEIIKRIDEIQI